jgi:hypothetical protein
MSVGSANVIRWLHCMHTHRIAHVHVGHLYPVRFRAHTRHCLYSSGFGHSTFTKYDRAGAASMDACGLCQLIRNGAKRSAIVYELSPGIRKLAQCFLHACKGCASLLEPFNCLRRPPRSHVAPLGVVHDHL